MSAVLKILLLEDNALDAEIIIRELRKGGLEFSHFLADNRDSYLNGLATFSPDIILSDHTLPAFGSKEALSISQQQAVKIPFILVTGTVSEEYAVEIMKDGAYDYILKDHLQRLPSAVLNAVEKGRMEIENQKFLEDLITNEALLKEAERLAHLGSWQFDLSTYESKWSDESYRILGFEPGQTEASFENMLRLVHTDDIAYVNEMTSDPMILKHDNIKFNFRIITLDNTIRYIHNELRVDRDLHGKPLKLTGFILDITESQEAQDALLKSEANLRTIFDNTIVGYVLVDQNLNIVSFNNIANQGMIEERGLPLKEGKNLSFYMPKERKEESTALYRDALQGKPVNFETSYFKKDKTAVWYQVQASPVKDSNNNALGLIIAITYITERKMAELEKEKLTEALKDSHSRLRKLVPRVQAAREEERLHIAREVHDELGQVLTAMKIEVSMLNKKIPIKKEFAFLQLAFVTIIRLIDKSIASVKKIATDLRPEMLDELGIAESIKWLAEEFKKNTGIDYSLSLSSGFIDLKADINVSTTLYRIVQESLTNISRHAEATKVKIALKTNEENLFLVIQDNGVGITEEQKNRKKSFGITGIKERVFLLNGNMEISGTPGKGTIVYAQIPRKHD